MKGSQTRLVTSALLGLVVALLPACAAAQGGGTTWDPPRNVSEDERYSSNPCIVADPWGMVHLFWDENLEDATSAVGDAIFYSRWDGAAWSAPVDVLMSPEGSGAAATQPRAVALPDGRLAVVWPGGFGDKLYFSTAPAGEAGAAQAWSWPQAIVSNRSGATQPRIALDTRNVLHILYLHYAGQDQGIWHLSSADGGRSWTAPRRVPGTYTGKANAGIFHPAFAIDGAGTLHAAWSGSSISGGYPPDGITYSRSRDGGNTWSSPVTLATGPFDFPVFGMRGALEVHLMWSGTLEQRRKFFQWSADGGLSWSRPGTIGELGGLQGTAQMAVDGDGELHLVFVSSHPAVKDSLFHSRWLGGGWSEPELLLEGKLAAQNLMYAVTAVSGGNVLHAAVMHPLPTDNGLGWQFEIFDVMGRLPARALAAAPLPTPTASHEMPASTAPVPSPIASPAPPTAVSGPWPASQPPPSGGSGPGVMVVGIVPVLLIMAAVVAIWLGRRR